MAENQIEKKEFEENSKTKHSFFQKLKAVLGLLFKGPWYRCAISWGIFLVICFGLGYGIWYGISCLNYTKEEKDRFNTNYTNTIKNPNDLFPTIYRIDRIQNSIITNEHFTPIYKNRFEEGEFRKRIQFMFGGKLNKIKFKYVGHSIESVLDRLPTAKIIQEDEDGWFVEAEVFGKGIDIWLRSQGQDIAEVS